MSTRRLYFFFFSLFTFHFSLFTSHLSVVSAAPPATITADRLEHFAEADKYVATGNVRLQKENVSVKADKAVFFAKAAHVEAEGHVIYEDPTTLINAERAELNIDTRTGKLYNAVILMKAQKNAFEKGKKTDYWINSDAIEKISDSHYYAKAATFTTCETIAEKEGRYRNPAEGKVFSADNPDWCFKGSNVDILIGDRIAGNNMVYRIKGLPVLYSPYFWAPSSDSERETGFLTPDFGNSTRKGFQFSPAFFWAIDENKDMTISLDYFTKRGIGKGIEYRSLYFNERERWFLYHLGDTMLHKTYYVINGSHELKFDDIKTFADVNYVNERDFFKEYAPKREERIERYTQSSAEASTLFNNSRLYLLGQYWIDLQNTAAHVPQRLPELGYVKNQTGIGPFMFSLNSSIANFTRKTDVSGQRLDLFPTISHSFGDGVQVFQSLSLRETAYSLTNTGTTFSANPHRDSMEYRANILTRFFKKYGSGTHIIEPSFSYTFIPSYSHALPVFDSIDLFNKTSLAQFSVLNTLALRGISLSARITQPYDFNAVAPAHTLQPTVIEGSVASGATGLTVNMTEDLNTLRTETLNATLQTTVTRGTSLSFAQFYTRANNTRQYNAGVTSVLSKIWTVSGNVWYDPNNHGLRDFVLHGIYTKQCWALDVSFQRRPGDTIRPPEYSLIFVVQLKGLGGLKLYEFGSSTQQKT